MLREGIEQTNKLKSFMEIVNENHGPIEVRPPSVKTIADAQQYLSGKKDQFHKIMQFLMRFVDVETLEQKATLDLLPTEEFARHFLRSIAQALLSIQVVTIRLGVERSNESDEIR